MISNELQTVRSLDKIADILYEDPTYENLEYIYKRNKKRFPEIESSLKEKFVADNNMMMWKTRIVPKIEMFTKFCE
jgi:hypothetical protein